jgi:hypothetical protein
MSASFRVRSHRGAALVLALALAVPLTPLDRGMVAAVADPAATTTTTAPAPVTTTNSIAKTTTASSRPTTTTPHVTSPSTASGTTDPQASSFVATATTASVTVKPGGTRALSDAVSSPPPQVIPTAVPQALTADPQAIQVAQDADITRLDAAPAAEGDLRLLTLAANRPNRPVLHLDQRWITYENFWGPVIINPFERALYIFWRIAGGVIQELVIPPFGKGGGGISQPGPTPVTVILPSETGEPDQVAGGVINGGGHDPGPDQPSPPDPMAPTESEDVCVVVHYQDAQYRPFIVRKVVDMGDDPQYGERKVLLDGVTPAWGAWTQSAECGTRFEVHRTQQLPGVDEPKQVPLPGGYPMQLASHESASSLDIFAVLAALIIAALMLVAVLVAIRRAKRNWSPNRDQVPLHIPHTRAHTRRPQPHTRVRAVTRPASPLVVTACKAPVAGEVMHAIRVKTYLEPGSPNIREVDDDVSRIG